MAVSGSGEFLPLLSAQTFSPPKQLLPMHVYELNPRRLMQRFMAVVLCFAFLAQANAQDASKARKVSGKITASVSGLGLSGATITVKGTKNMVASNDNGEYTVMAAP